MKNFKRKMRSSFSRHRNECEMKKAKVKRKPSRIKALWRVCHLLLSESNENRISRTLFSWAHRLFRSFLLFFVCISQTQHKTTMLTWSQQKKKRKQKRREPPKKHEVQAPKSSKTQYIDKGTNKKNTHTNRTNESFRCGRHFPSLLDFGKYCWNVCANRRYLLVKIIGPRRSFAPFPNQQRISPFPNFKWIRVRNWSAWNFNAPAPAEAPHILPIAHRPGDRNRSIRMAHEFRFVSRDVRSDILFLDSFISVV